MNKKDELLRYARERRTKIDEQRSVGRKKLFEELLPIEPDGYDEHFTTAIYGDFGLKIGELPYFNPNRPNANVIFYVVKTCPTTLTIYISSFFKYDCFHELEEKIAEVDHLINFGRLP